MKKFSTALCLGLCTLAVGASSPKLSSDCVQKYREASAFVKRYFGPRPNQPKVHHSAKTLAAWKEWRESRWREIGKVLQACDEAAIAYSLREDGFFASRSTESLFGGYSEVQDAQDYFTVPFVFQPDEEVGNLPPRDDSTVTGFVPTVFGASLPYPPFPVLPTVPTPPTTPTAPTPEPGSILLLGSGLALCSAAIRLRKWRTDL